MVYILKFFRILFVAIVVIFVDVTFRYFLEETSLIKVRPRFVPNYGSSHFGSMLDMYVWVTVIMGWLYFILVISFEKSIEKIKKSHWLINIMIASMLYFLFYLIYVMFAEGGRADLIYEGLLSSIMVGASLSILSSLTK